MRYSDITTGTFIERPNRFIAYVDIDGHKEKCHVKNTGRCKELLIPDAKVVLSISDNPERATKYDLIAVYKGNMLVNIDSQAPNKVVMESIGRIPGFENAEIHPEYTYGNSRIDVYASSGNKKMLMEIKGVTLERDEIALFPDAPTERGLKHVKELEKALSDGGYETYVMFLIQMSGPKVFSPNYDMHEEFGKEVEKAYKAGVKVLAYDCIVKEDTITLGDPVDIRFRDHS